MGKMKLLHIAFVGGGVDIAIRMINENIDPNNFVIKVIREIEHNTYFDKSNSKISSEVIPVKRKISYSDLINLIKLLKTVKKYNPDIIHVHSSKAGVLGRIVGRILKVPTFYTPHAFSYLSTPNKIKRNIYLFIEKIIKSIAPESKIIACSESEYFRAIEEVGFRKENVHLYNNSIPRILEDQLVLPDNFNQPSSYLCTIGRPSYQKNLHVLIEVVKNLHEKGFKETLVIVGAGYYSPELESVKGIISKFDLDDYILLLPWVKRSEALAILSRAKLYLSSALYEGMPLSIIEAMALGIPIVASNVDGNKDLIVNGTNGFLIDNMSIEDYSEKIIRILSNPKIKDLFSKQARLDYRSKFNTKFNIQKLENIFKS